MFAFVLLWCSRISHIKYNQSIKWTQILIDYWSYYVFVRAFLDLVFLCTWGKNGWKYLSACSFERNSRKYAGDSGNSRSKQSVFFSRVPLTAFDHVNHIDIDHESASIFGIDHFSIGFFDVINVRKQTDKQTNRQSSKHTPRVSVTQWRCLYLCLCSSDTLIIVMLMKRLPMVFRLSRSFFAQNLI